MHLSQYSPHQPLIKQTSQIISVSPMVASNHVLVQAYGMEKGYQNMRGSYTSSVSNHEIMSPVRETSRHLSRDVQINRVEHPHIQLKTSGI